MNEKPHPKGWGFLFLLVYTLDIASTKLFCNEI